MFQIYGIVSFTRCFVCRVVEGKYFMKSNYGSISLFIKHEGVGLREFEKVK